MRNVTVSVPDHVYRQARVWAAQRDQSISSVVTFILENLPNIPRAARRFPVVAENQTAAPSQS